MNSKPMTHGMLLVGFLGFMISILLTDQVRADTYHQYKACLRNCINTTNPWTWARAKCGADCTAAWADQKISININISIASTGYNVRRDIPNLLVEAGSLVTVDFDIETLDPLNSIELILVDDANNPDDPDFGTIVGTDVDGGDGWSITFDSTPYGNFSGFLLARADFDGHDEEIDGDQAVILIGTSPLEAPGVPTTTQWGLVTLALVLLGTGAMLIARRRAAVTA
jgi:hypothetical protein